MVPIFKCTELIAVLSLILLYQPQGFTSRYFHVAAVETTATPPFQNSVVTVTVTVVAAATQSESSAAPTSAPISSSTTVSSSALPTSTSAPVIPNLTPGQLPNSFPQNTTVTSGINFDTSWQEFYRVTQGLPNITFPLGNNYAGNLPVQRSGHPNNTLFFWGFENRVGSLTMPAGQIQLSPWLIWLGGGKGPGSSGLFTSMIANGPMLLHRDLTISQNPNSLSNLMDTIWVDQPVGTGFSTADSTGYAKDENDVASDFIGFLSNLVKIFPSLATRPLYLAGEDYAGVYISYISKALLATSSPPVILQKIVIGNGLLYDVSQSTNIATTSIIGSFPQLIKFDQGVFDSFQSKAHLCGYDVNLTYPQQSPLPYIEPTRRVSSLWSSVASRAQKTGLLKRRSKRDISLNNQLDPYYGCSIFDEAVDYAANFSSPWSPGIFDLFDVSDALSLPPSFDGGIYFNAPQVRGALHAPLSKDWTSMDQYPFGSTLNFSSATNFFGDPSPPPATFFDDLVSTATSKNVEIVLYSSGNNAIAHHRSLEILIQNTTFGGTRGFTRKPSTPWVDDSGNVAGIIHQERGILYALFDNVGSFTPRANPTAAHTFFRQYVLNSNTTGSITVDSNNKLTVFGGEDPNVAADAPRVASKIFLGAGATQSTLVAPSATVAAWKNFLKDVSTRASTSGAQSRLSWSGRVWPGVLVLCTSYLVLGSLI
ncbi:alpha/beta-hydrolase [Lactarius pseudohatsudake]|nr:alpha/beta-hydrolase [Lactarius pseudohatsudake]